MTREAKSVAGSMGSRPARPAYNCRHPSNSAVQRAHVSRCAWISSDSTEVERPSKNACSACALTCWMGGFTLFYLCLILNREGSSCYIRPYGNESDQVSTVFAVSNRSFRDLREAVLQLFSCPV